MVDRAKFAAALAAALTIAGPAAAETHYAPGITDTEIKIGQTAPYSGPASVVGTMAKGHVDYFKMINDEGGVSGRKVTLISLDDGFNPAKTVEQVRKMVEGDGVAFLFGSAGSATNLVIRPYIEKMRVPLLFPISGSRAFYDPEHHPWVIGWYPTYHLDGLMNAKYVLAHAPHGKVAVLYQNDEFGREHEHGFRDGLGDRAKDLIVAEATYEPFDPTVESQVIQLQQSGANVFYIIALPKFAAQAIRKSSDLGWKSMRLLDYGAQSITGTLMLAGLDRSKGIISHIFIKDPKDPRWKDDPDMVAFHAWEKKYYPEADPTDPNIITAYGQGFTLVQVLKQCGDDLSRENIVRQAANLHDLRVPLILSTLSTSPTDYEPFKSMQPMQFDGQRWQLIPE